MFYYQYTYLYMGILAGIVWLALFFWRKDLRSQMLFGSFLLGLLSPFGHAVYIVDYWHPETLGDARIGIEAVIVGFYMGGIGAVLYEFVFRKRLHLPQHMSKKRAYFNNVRFFSLATLTVLMFFGSFYLLDFSSLEATILATVIPIAVIFILRRDLIANSLYSGLLLLIAATIIYNILELMTPGWVEKFWLFYDFPPIIVLNMPLNDIIWYFLIGALLGPAYEFWKEAYPEKNQSRWWHRLARPLHRI